VPPYVIAHDRTLAELAARRPASRAALHGVFGMGPARIETWGDALLEAIAPPS
jgi:ATP-dependent DNA helicase RecQ